VIISVIDILLRITGDEAVSTVVWWCWLALGLYVPLQHQQTQTDSFHV